MADDDDNGLPALRASINAMHDSICRLRQERDRPWPQLPEAGPTATDRTGWNFGTYSIHINQRFSDLSLQLQQRFEAQQTSVSTAMVAAEKAVNAALTAAEKAVDKAEQAQSLRNEAQNEFRKSLSDLSGLMWTTKEGTAAVDSLRRELDSALKNVEDKVAIGARERNNALEALHRELMGRLDAADNKINEMSTQSANIQGRFTMLGIIWGIAVVAASLAVHWFR